jgi:hypothetical protein
MTIYHFPALDDSRESILISLFPSTLDTLPSMVTVTFSQEATEPRDEGRKVSREECRVKMQGAESEEQES